MILSLSRGIEFPALVYRPQPPLKAVCDKG
jgi:hypothetical protein